MPRSLLLASTVSLGLLSGFIFILVILISIFVGDMGGGLIGAITTTIVINFLLWLVSPWLSDWMYRFFYKNQWTTLEELAVESPKTAEIIRKICEAEKIKLPKIGVIPDDNPNAFTYGSGPWNARIIITHGIIRFLSDEERSSVVAHELGHIANRDFIIMTIASTLLQILYEIYYYTNKQKRGNSNSRSKLAIVGLIALIFYWLGSYILLYLSRVREYAADAFSAKYTDANLLADALIKIAMGILSTPGDARLVKSTRYIGVVGDVVSKQLGLVYKNCEKSGSFELLGRSLLFDLKSPWAFLAELSSTHPLSGKRIGALMKQTLAPKYDLASIEARLQIDTNRLYQGFARDLTLVIIARLAPWILELITLIALIALHIPIEGGFLFVVTGFLVGIVVSMLIKLSMMYPATQDEPTTILEAMGDIYASPVRGRKISLEGQLVGRGIPGYIFSEDMLMQDKTGLIYVDYESRFGWIGNLFYSLKKAAENIGKDVRTSGWFFRDMSSRIVADRITGEGIDLKGGVRLWMLIGIMLMTVVSGVVGVMASGVYEESQGFMIEQKKDDSPMSEGRDEKRLAERNNENIRPIENSGSIGNKVNNSQNEQIFTNNVTIELSTKATEGKTLQISSSIDIIDIPNTNNGNYVTIKSTAKDRLILTANDTLYLAALRYNNAPIKMTPASTATYLILQIKGMLSLPEDQLLEAISNIKSHKGYETLVSYIDYKVNSGYKDPLNVELDYALMEQIVTIANDLKVQKKSTKTSIDLVSGCDRETQTAETFFTFDPDRGIITRYNDDGPKNVIIPCQIGGVDVTKIGRGAFAERKPYGNNVTSVFIPGTITEIGDYAFYGNELSSIDIPSSVTYIGEYAFSKNKISKLNIKGNITSLARDIFSENKLTSVIIPESVEEIGIRAFANNQITSVKIPINVKVIENLAFTDNQIHTIESLGSISRIEHGVFSRNQLNSITLSEGITYIDSQAFANNKLTSITMATSIKNIGDGAFYHQDAPYGSGTIYGPSSGYIKDIYTKNTRGEFDKSIFTQYVDIVGK